MCLLPFTASSHSSLSLSVLSVLSAAGVGCIKQLSSADGQNWSAPDCLTMTKPLPGKLGTSLSPGPGAGIQLPSGRLLFAIHSTFHNAMVIFSDDGGHHWQSSTMPSTYSDGTPFPTNEGGDGTSLPGSECQMAPARNGSVLLSCRFLDSTKDIKDAQLRSVSNDGGRSFAPPWLDCKYTSSQSFASFLTDCL